MATTYITDADLFKEIASRLGSTPSQLSKQSSGWSTIVASANQDAYQKIISTMLGRNYTQAQIDAWDRRVEFNRRIAICYAFEDNAVLRDYNDQSITRICRAIKEIDDPNLKLTVAGEVVEPPTSVSGADWGEFYTGGDNFQLDNFP